MTNRLDRWKRCLGAMVLCLTASLRAEPLSVDITPPGPPVVEHFNMGTATRPDGATITLDSRSLLLNGKPWTPAIGEFHYTRYPANEWREELLKMKAGGIDIVSTYVFWIHHEEIEGQFDWSERRDLHHFLELCKEVGLKAIVRCGPWDHGEVRNGGLPDWLLAKGFRTRSNDTNYLAVVKIFYGEIAKQLAGLYWKDGGPVIGIQFENEYSGPAEHLLTLKRIGRDMGMDVPLYTRTGWNQPSGHMPFGEMVPLYGVYAEGFWDRTLTPMPAGYWKGFQFSKFRVDDATYQGLPGQGGTPDPPDVAKYPYLTCEIGGGMMNSYHRRILFNPADNEATTLIKIGSGSTSPGYYMYHGGENPDGKLTTLQETQATGYWNDMPVKNYDFQAPLGQYGQIRPQYHWLRRLHLFLHEWGANLAEMPALLPAQRPASRTDFQTLRWDARSDGNSGFIFVNNYQRLADLPAKPNTEFAVNIAADPIVFPETPVTIPADARFFWPFNFDLGHGVQLSWATAQPVTAIDDGNTRTVFFAETAGIPAQFAFPETARVKINSGELAKAEDSLIAKNLQPATTAALEIPAADGTTIRVVLLSDADSCALWKGNWRGKERAFLTRAGLVMDGNTLQLTSTNRAQLTVGVFPPPDLDSDDGKKMTVRDGIFERFTPAAPDAETPVAQLEKIQDAGPLREIHRGKIREAVAAEPDDSDFKDAAVWRIKLPANVDLATDPLLRLHYIGDVARVTLNGKLLTDDFYNGNPLDVGLRRYAPEILNGDLRIAILPLRKNAPIYMAQQALPDFGTNQSVVSINAFEIVPRYQVQLQ